ncbi:unnamed protein product [Bursaphelenchus xylophilus]|uniref:(pine wood nematode) hypothetical protein n=1 Tax=Bursaphelenchus xylophilus TaxID=6326 RepID=A0A1I7S0R9_BURXY|nr:unnamed protein product [Bursaphelenchus xylophilus]CAG9088318.1 unnamed protein product [Bursaphelenchus xylophilus]
MAEYWESNIKKGTDEDYKKYLKEGRSKMHFVNLVANFEAVRAQATLLRDEQKHMDMALISLPLIDERIKRAMQYDEEYRLILKELRKQRRKNLALMKELFETCSNHKYECPECGEEETVSPEEIKAALEQFVKLKTKEARERSERTELANVPKNWIDHVDRLISRHLQERCEIGP